jgi:hypothetical protein
VPVYLSFLTAIALQRDSPVANRRRENSTHFS